MTLGKIGALAFGLILIGSLTPVSAENAAGVTDPDDFHANAIKSLLTNYAAAVARADIEGMARYIDTSEAFSVIEGGHVNWGWRDYRDNHLGPEFSNPDFKILDYAIDDIRVHYGPEFAYAIYRYRIVMEVKGERREHSAFETVVLVMADSGWKIRHLHS